MKSPLSIAALAGVALACGAAQADSGKLLLTGGVSTIAGSAGGGLTPWAVIGSNATEGEVGVSAYATRAATQDYSLTATAWLWACTTAWSCRWRGRTLMRRLPLRSTALRRLA